MSAPTPRTARLMLLDTYGLVYRSFYALPPMSIADGTPVNAVYGFTMMLNRLLTDERPTHAIAAFDRGLPAERLERFPAYKAQREAMPDDLRIQFPLVRKVLQSFGIPILEMEGQEADDVIATLARQSEEAGEEALVVTGDLDLLQIVDAHTTVLAQRRGISDLARYNPQAVRERYELEPAQLPDYRGLKGDPSDNLPGIPGVGEKTAIKLIQAAGSLDRLLAHPELAGSAKLQALIETHGEQARICRDVSVIRRDLPIELDWDASRYQPPTNDDRYRLYAALEFRSLLAKLDPPSEMPLFHAQATLQGEYRSFVAIVDPPEYARLAVEIPALADAPVLALALHNDALVLSAQRGHGLAFSIDALAHEPIAQAMRRIVARTKLMTYDAKRIAHALRARGFAWISPSDDAMIGAHLCDPARTFAHIEEAAHALLDVRVGENVAAAADATLQLVAAERGILAQRAQVSLYEEIEVPLTIILAKMEATGIRVDASALDALRDELDARIDGYAKHIVDFAGEAFNIGSPQQLGSMLFEKLKIPGGKKNKTGWATGADVLQILARQYPICGLVLEWREATKLKNTYVDVLPKLIDPRDGRLHTQFNQTATATGRLSSTNPNLQNIPIRTELGRRIRKAFVAADDAHVLLAADYSQIELRLMAHLSGDLAMRQAFEQGQDIHAFTARQIFGISAAQEIDDEQRRIAKSVNFGLLYGMSDFGLAQRLEIDRSRAREITQAYFTRFPAVRGFIERVIEDARRDGYVSTVLGRRRYMPALTSSNHVLRAAAEREATNAPLQGSAADLMKLAMVRIDRALQAEGLKSRMLLQIHDEVVFDVPRSELAAVATLVKREMEHAQELSVPLHVNIEVGENLYDVSEYADA